MASMRDFGQSFDVDAYNARRAAEKREGAKRQGITGREKLALLSEARGLERVGKTIEPSQPTRKPKAMPRISEHDEQCIVMRWRDAQLKNYPGIELLYAIPNGGKRNKAVAVNLRAEGVQSGVCDLSAPCPRRGYHGLFVEMKAVGGRVSKLQQAFIDAVTAEGYLARVCYGADEAIQLLTWYFGAAERSNTANDYK